MIRSCIEIGIGRIYYCKNAQKQITTFVNFVHTYADNHAIIIPVKTPQYII